MAPIDWLATLNVSNTVDNLHRELVGDWYNDPWGWPEIPYLGKAGIQTLVDYLNSADTGRVAELDVPKEGWGVRPAVVLDVLDRLAYQALVDKMSHHLIGNLPSTVYGWRLPHGSPIAGKYSHQDIQWEGYRSHLASGAAWFDYGLTTDVVSCFATISLDIACSTIDDVCPKGLPTKRLTTLLEGFGKVSPREGLPQRSTASAVIANKVLSVFDVVMADHATDIPVFLLAENDGKSSGTRRSHVRWMDDMWLFSDSEAQLRKAQYELQEAALSTGLNLGTAKTAVYEGAELQEAALQIQHSAVDSALEDPKDERPLEELIDVLLDKRDDAGRTSVKFAINRMLKVKSKHRARDFVTSSTHMPHVADAMARLFAGTFTSQSLERWFLDQAKGDWWLFDWSTAHYLRMFPTAYSPSTELIDWVADRVAEGTCNVQLLAACAQRLATWAPDKLRGAVRGSLGHTYNPHSRRILVLAALEAGESSRQVARWLGQEAENRIIQDLLAATNYSPPKVNAAYAKAIH
jgi:hypothetical protein